MSTENNFQMILDDFCSKLLLISVANFPYSFHLFKNFQFAQVRMTFLVDLQTIMEEEHLWLSSY